MLTVLSAAAAVVRGYASAGGVVPFTPIPLVPPRASVPAIGDYDVDAPDYRRLTDPLPPLPLSPPRVSSPSTSDYDAVAPDYRRLSEAGAWDENG